MADRKKILVTPLDLDNAGDHSLEEFMVMWNEALLKIPEQYRDVAVVELDGGYDSRPTFRIKFYRDETDREMADRLSQEMKRLRDRDVADRETYERLKKRFEPGVAGVNQKLLRGV